MLIDPRKKRTYPVGTFINTVPRVLAIIQLSLAFTLICWNLSLPFTGDLLDYKSRLSIYQTIMGKTNFLKAHNIEESSELFMKQVRNRDRFEKLPYDERMRINEEYRELQTQSSKSFLYKLREGATQLLFKQPTFQMAWLCLALIIPLMLLLKIESSRQAIWLLPLVAAIYGIDNLAYAPPPRPSFDASLYPTEQTIITKYLKTPLSENIFEQREQLLKGWQLYLIDRWLSQVPSSESPVYNQQVEEAEYAFHLTRLRQLSSWKTSSNYTYKEPVALLALYVIWNLFFAFAVRHSLVPAENRNVKRQV